MGPVARIACACLLALVATAAAQPTPQQRIAMTAKPSVVRVWSAYVATYSIRGKRFQKAIGGSGTGFFITPDGYIATNAHVVSDVYDGDETAKERLYKLLLKQLDSTYATQIAKLTDEEAELLLRDIKVVSFERLAYVVLPNGERLDYEIKQFGKPASGRDAAILKVNIANAPALPIGDSTRMQVADQIVVIGYPGVADMTVLLDETSLLQASVTDGTISSLKRAASGERILQISAPITHGNSGGPALDLKGNVIGLATFANASEIQGFNFLVASSTLNDLIKIAKITPKPGETTRLWQQGLALYWTDQYTAAIAKFKEVAAQFPSHSEAAVLIGQSEQAKKEGKEKPPKSHRALVVGLAVGGGVVLVGGVVLLLIARRRKRSAPVPAPQTMYRAPSPAAQLVQLNAAQPSAPHSIIKTVPVHGPASASPQTAFAALGIGSLTCTRGQLAGQRFALTATGIIVGRQPGVAHLLVNDHRASGKHVWIGLDNGRLVAIDQGTTNGTYINDVASGRITRHELRDGDVVIVGEPDCLSLEVKFG